MSATAQSARTRVGRFELLHELGRGAQGAVHLATDTRLGRQVALKTLSGGAGAQALRTLLDEARIVSGLQHANIVPLFDAGEDRGVPYLVFEYVEGRTLAQVIREQGRLPVAQAVRIAIDLASGVSYAHSRQVVHRDLKPGNVMLTPEGVPRLMDFGIARRGAADDVEDNFSGTPSYVSPEYIRDRVYGPACDQFALGVILYEMLTGVPPARAADPFATLNLIVNAEFAPPSRANAEVDEELDRIVMKALEKAPDERHAGVAAFALALAAWLEPADGAAAESDERKGTLEFLLRRLRHKSDFPALTGTLSSINRVTGDGHEHLSVLCNTILKDFSITNKLLRVVNSACYSQFGGSISTVSRAVGILGFDAVRNLAVSLLLFEHLHDRTQAAALKDEVISSYFSGILARQFAVQAGINDGEQAFICAMFHGLGRLLVTFYLKDEAQAIAKLAAVRGYDEARSVREVLGMSYEELGEGVGTAWNLPESILASMRKVTGKVERRPQGDAERLCLLADFANSVTEIIRTSGPGERGAKLSAIVDRFSAGTGISRKMLDAGLRESVDRLRNDAAILGFNPAASPLVASAAAASGAPVAVAAAPPAMGASQDTIDTVVTDARLKTADEKTLLIVPEAPNSPANRQAILAAGVQDIVNTLVGDYELNDLLRIILETMYRGIGFSRVLMFVRDASRQNLRCRLGFGVEADRIVQKGVSIPVHGPRDLFYAAVSQGADLCIEDIDAEKVRAHVPEWYRKAIDARGLVLLPVVVNRVAVAVIYADAQQPGALRFSLEELNLLKTLRNQAVLAMRQKTGG